MAITKDVLMGKLVEDHPEVVDTLLESGMHCLGCPSSQMESLGDACWVHGLDADEIVRLVNDRIGGAR